MNYSKKKKNNIVFTVIFAIFYQFFSCYYIQLNNILQTISSVHQEYTDCYLKPPLLLKIQVLLPLGIEDTDKKKKNTRIHKSLKNQYISRFAIKQLVLWVHSVSTDWCHVFFRLTVLWKNSLVKVIRVSSEIHDKSTTEVL